LLELLEHLGFSRHWRNWISNLLSAASTRILLNGNPGQRICHAGGLRQGNPLPPLLFVLTMEALNGMFRLMESRGLLTSLQALVIRHRLSLYAYDVVIFIVPTTQDIIVVRAVLDMFVGALGLHTNVAKC
jgi:hypothetical protein